MIYLRCTYTKMGKDYYVLFNAKKSFIPGGGWAIVTPDNFIDLGKNRDSKGSGLVQAVLDDWKGCKEEALVIVPHRAGRQPEAYIKKTELIIPLPFKKINDV